MKCLRRFFAASLVFLLFACAAWAADGWAELAKPGAIVLFRHANAPRVGHPAAFKLDDCATQRKLVLRPLARTQAAPVAQARAVLSRWRGPGALVVVTHQVVIQGWWAWARPRRTASSSGRRRTAGCRCSPPSSRDRA